MNKIKGYIDELKSLDPKYVYNWPLGFRLLIFVAIFLVTVAAGGFFYIQGKLDELDVVQKEEGKLREEFKEKKRQAINLPLYKQQLVDVENSFGELLKQLPNSAQVSSLLIDINQAGISRGLQFELFKPKQEKLYDFYAELPIEIKVIGNYTDIGNFVSDISRLPRIVMMSELRVKYLDAKTQRVKDTDPLPDQLVLESTAKTFRYLDQEEIEKIRKAKESAKKGKAPPKAAKTDGGKK